ncbi:MAG: hypothetical protein IKD18_04390 [Clostridia bacterium]|nr:hypothetical protein [Clostridia bacterium]
MRDPIHQNPAIFDITGREDYAKAVISYLAGMSDRYAMDCFNEIISF